jgi:hypothetical protein
MAQENCQFCTNPIKPVHYSRVEYTVSKGDLGWNHIWCCQRSECINNSQKARNGPFPLPRILPSPLTAMKIRGNFPTIAEMVERRKRAYYCEQIIAAEHGIDLDIPHYLPSQVMRWYVSRIFPNMKFVTISGEKETRNTPDLTKLHYVPFHWLRTAVLHDFPDIRFCDPDGYEIQYCKKGEGCNLGKNAESESY